MDLAGLVMPGLDWYARLAWYALLDYARLAITRPVVQ
jgi:hypothetical protein